MSSYYYITGAQLVSIQEHAKNILRGREDDCATLIFNEVQKVLDTQRNHGVIVKTEHLCSKCRDIELRWNRASIQLIEDPNVSNDFWNQCKSEAIEHEKWHTDHPNEEWK